MPEVGVGERLKTVVVGYGFIGRVHSERWSKIDEAKLTAVVDIVPERAREAAETYRCNAYTSLSEALDREKPDIVDICTPTYTHKQLVLEALNAHANVVCEKPLALSLQDCREIIKAAKESGMKFMVAHCLRFFPDYSTVKRLVEGGEVGEPRIARAYRLSAKPGWATWYLNQDKSGGVMVDLAIHDIDFLRWLFADEVSRVYAQALKPRDVKAQTHAQVLLKFRKGYIAFVEASWSMPDGFPFTTYFEVAGTDGIVLLDSRASTPLTVHRKGGVEELSPVGRDGYLLELQHFARCVLEDKAPMVSGEEAVKTLEVCFAAVESSLTGEPVNLPLEGV